VGCKKSEKKIGNTDFKVKKISRRLTETGRIQYFYHSPSSELPVRDVKNECRKGHKTEPHIEIGAENFLEECYQKNNIIPFLEKSDKYLFLLTRYKDERYIVGYIIKEYWFEFNGHYGVRGKTKIYSFKDAYPFKKLVLPGKNPDAIRIKKFNEEDTKKIITHFNGRKNILAACIKEIKALDENNETCYFADNPDRCPFINECLRWK